MKEICIERTEHTQNRSIQYPLPALYLTEATFHEIKIRFTIPGRYNKKFNLLLQLSMSKLTIDTIKTLLSILQIAKMIRQILSNSALQVQVCVAIMLHVSTCVTLSTLSTIYHLQENKQRFLYCFCLFILKFQSSHSSIIIFMM